MLAKYDVLEELGHGGMATVYRAHDARLSRDVAVKVLHPHLRESREIAHRFSAEAKAVAKLRHANIVEVFDVSSPEEEEQYLVVEFVRGLTLRKILQKHGALPPEIGAAIAVELLAALAHAHDGGVVHRDVKPENVLAEHRQSGGPSSKDGVSRTPTPAPIDAGATGGPASGGTTNRGERVAVKLTDFGIAKLLDAQGVTSTGQVLGSPAHMAPEQIEGGDVDGRADVFGLGVLFYECIVGHLPFEGNNPAQVLRRVLDGSYPSAERERPVVGKVWSQILDRALARTPDARFASAESMRDAISAELTRLGCDRPRVELEAWFDDPEGWGKTHEARLIGRLCELGADARKRGDAVAAAADYNRALAYAPNDPQLLKIVSSMMRAEARMRLVRRTAPLVLAAALLGTTAYGVARAVKGKETATPPVPSGLLASASSAASSASPIASVSPERSSAPVIPTAVEGVSTRPVVNIAQGTPSAAHSTSKAGVKRTLTFASLRPAFGVHMTVDGAPAPDPAQNQSITLDDKAHTLSFTCEGDRCEPKTITIAPGEEDERIAIELRIHPARVVVEGDPSRSYGIEGRPTLTLASGTTTDVVLRAGVGEDTVWIYDRTDPTRRREVKLVSGKLATVSFKSP